MKEKETAAVLLPDADDFQPDVTAQPDEEEEEEIVLSAETMEEIGSPDREMVFQKVCLAYEEAKRKREKYKKAGPIFVLVSGVVFLTLMFTLENKILFLILWVITVLYTAALMIRAEYKYHQFQDYLGIVSDESDGEEENEEENEEQDEEKDEKEEQKQEDPQSDVTENNDSSQKAEQEGQV